ncbi:hypothetical protein HMPREF2936_06450 [Neisseria sp. HMSC064F04]|uniref:hypothetical protein n=1 Tax=Neisseria mucosa TaxID=488 RepID=UPI0008A9E78F|nr:hypothetical protein [Neisseria mucosa]OHR41129.1 hypothetical protein HMPREF2936_06450 [Neisseria sp. HMSC064F04]
MKKKPINLWLEKLSLWGILALLVMSIIIPLLFKNNNMWTNLSSNIGIALFSALSISKFLQKETKDLIFNEIPLLQRANEIGIASIPEDGSIEILDFKESKDFIVAMNDGKFFLSKNAENLCSRFEKEGMTTIFIFLDGESDAAKLLCYANGKDNVDSYKNKINQAIKEIKDFANEYPKHNFEIYTYSKGYFRTSIILTDTKALVGTYRNSPGKRKLPLHILISKCGSEFYAIKNDIMQLKDLSNQVQI